MIHTVQTCKRKFALTDFIVKCVRLRHAANAGQVAKLHSRHEHFIGSTIIHSTQQHSFPRRPAATRSKLQLTLVDLS